MFNHLIFTGLFFYFIQESLAEDGFIQDEMEGFQNIRYV